MDATAENSNALKDNTTLTDKQRVRAAALARRNAIEPCERQRKSALICNDVRALVDRWLLEREEGGHGKGLGRAGVSAPEVGARDDARATEVGERDSEAGARGAETDADASGDASTAAADEVGAEAGAFSLSHSHSRAETASNKPACAQPPAQADGGGLVVAGYAAMKSEVDARAFLDVAYARGWTVCLPCMVFDDDGRTTAPATRSAMHDNTGQYPGNMRGSAGRDSESSRGRADSDPHVSRETLSRRMQKVDVSRETLVHCMPNADVSRETSAQQCSTHASISPVEPQQNAARAENAPDAARQPALHEAVSRETPAPTTHQAVETAHMVFFRMPRARLDTNRPAFLDHPARAFSLAHLRADGWEEVAPEQIDVAITPLVAFDRTNARLGYGGGNYDRLLAELREDALVVGVAFTEQRVEHVPLEPHDLPLPHLVSA